MKISHACQDYLVFCRHQKQLSAHSLRAYQFDLGEFQRFAGDSRLITDCDKHLLRDYARYLLTERALKEASTKRRIACLKALFRWLETEELLEINPFHKAAIRIKLPSRLPRSLGKDEIRSLLRAPLLELGFHKREDCHTEALLAAARSRYGHLQFTALVSLELLFATGVRVGELVETKLDDLNLKEGTIYIHGKGDRERVVFLPDRLITHLLRDYLSHRASLSPDHTQIIVNSRDTTTHPFVPQEFIGYCRLTGAIWPRHHNQSGFLCFFHGMKAIIFDVSAKQNPGRIGAKTKTHLQRILNGTLPNRLSQFVIMPRHCLSFLPASRFPSLFNQSEKLLLARFDIFSVLFEFIHLLDLAKFGP
uniref:Site-specific recombinase XerD n=1 Tax=Candidatus Kentrum sp. UNK TaxID=2126344 RepID=A0A451A6F3_9GAMM|nr:MAG: Site-specific recombinase XerD [Candidatus Kentron sp. UNK]VFK70452.1 MAG: Site-specific recombinase XerD [Candidatus Kentron sp. UNK]